MIINKHKFQPVLLFIGFFFAFTGTYATDLIIGNYITLPGGSYRFLILISLFCFFFISEKKNLTLNSRVFFVFSFIYIVRLLVEIIQFKYYYITPTTVLINFTLGGVIPFYIISKLKLNGDHYNIIFKAIIFGGMLFGAATYFFYGQYLGEVERLSAKTSGDEEIIGPLILSYVSTTALGVGLSYLYGHKLTVVNTIVLAILLIVSTIPFFLGASRGSVVALLFPFLLIFLARGGIKRSIASVVLILALLYVGVVLSEYFGSGLVERFSVVESDLEYGGEGNVRVTMWKQGLSQFYSSPLFGDGLRLRGYDVYPHNLFVETLLTTGVLGIFPMGLLIIAGFIKAVRVFRYNPKYSWVGVLFIQCFVQSMFSFSIYSNKWIWIALALLFALDVVGKIENRNQHSLVI